VAGCASSALRERSARARAHACRGRSSQRSAAPVGLTRLGSPRAGLSVDRQGGDGAAAGVAAGRRAAGAARRGRQRRRAAGLAAAPAREQERLLRLTAQPRRGPASSAPASLPARGVWPDAAAALKHRHARTRVLARVP